jgi:hypothetical protein
MFCKLVSPVAAGTMASAVVRGRPWGVHRNRISRGFAFAVFGKKKTLYEVLEVENNSDTKTVKKAFQQKGMERVKAS